MTDWAFYYLFWATGEKRKMLEKSKISEKRY